MYCQNQIHQTRRNNSTKEDEFTMIYVIKSKPEVTWKLVLKLVEAIRYGNLYQELEQIDRITEEISRK